MEPTIKALQSILNTMVKESKILTLCLSFAFLASKMHKNTPMPYVPPTLPPSLPPSGVRVRVRVRVITEGDRVRVRVQVNKGVQSKVKG